MLKQIFTIALLLCFTLYSQSTLVLWSLYFFEQHDIVMYYETAENTSQGRDFVQLLCDGSKSENSSPRALLKLNQNAKPLELHGEELIQPLRVELPIIVLLNSSYEGLQALNDVFRPPCRTTTLL